MAGIGIGIGIGNAEFPGIGIGIGIEDLVFQVLVLVLVLTFSICQVLSDQPCVHGSKDCPQSHFQVSNLANNAVIMLLLSYLIELEQFCEGYVAKLTASIGIGIEVLDFWPVLVLVLVLKIPFFRYWYWNWY